MNSYASQLSKPPYPIASQFIFALNNHALRMNCYNEHKIIDHNLTSFGVRDSAKGRGRNHGRGGSGRLNNFNAQGRSFLPFG